jgi:mercuric ion transport protein
VDISRSTRLLSGGAIASAVAASICCFGPLLLAVLGLGGGAVLLKLAPYRPYSLAAATVFLAGGFYLAYRRRPTEECSPGSVCDRPVGRGSQRFALWVVAVIVLLAALFPYFSKWLF